MQGARKREMNTQLKICFMWKYDLHLSVGEAYDIIFPCR